MAKFSLIFMYDDGKTIRWRMGPALLRALLVTLGLLPVIAGCSLWLNWMLYQERQAMQAEKSALRREVDSNAQTAARLANLEQYLSRNDPDSLSKLVVALAPPPVPAASPSELLLTSVLAGAGQPAVAKPDLAQPQTGDAGSASTDTAAHADTALDPAAHRSQTANTSGDAIGNVTGNATGDATGDASGDAPGNPASDASSGMPSLGGTVFALSSSDSDPEEPTGPPDQAEDPPVEITATDSGSDSVDKGLARVENLTARRVGARSLRISFDLYNTEQVPLLAGKAAFELVLKDGRSFPLDTYGETSYRINRLKKIVGNPILPTGITQTEGAMIRVNIFADNELIYRTLTPL